MNTRNAALYFALLLVISASGCMSFHNPPDPGLLPPTEMRAMQTRTFDIPDNKHTLKAVVDVLQDDGFIVDYAQTELGILHATKTSGATDDQEFRPSRNFFPGTASFNPNAITKLDATVNVSAFGKQTKIRVGFLRTISTSSLGYPNGVTFANPVVDAKIYQEFFAKLDRGLFLQHQGL